MRGGPSLNAPVRVASSAHTSPVRVADDLARQLGDDAELVLFFVSSKRDIAAIDHELDHRYPNAVTAGCTTAGEISPAGCTRGSVSALALCPPARAAAALIEDMSSLAFEDGVELVHQLTSRLGLGALDAQSHCLITLTDGLSAREEILVASMATALGDTPLVGGGAADDFNFAVTHVALNGSARPSSSVVLLVEPGIPFAAFHKHHFQPSERRVVITEATPGDQAVHEFDGKPAIELAASWWGVSPAEVRARFSELIGNKPLTLGHNVGGQYFMRSATHSDGDTVYLGGSVEEGMVLRLMIAGDLIAESEAGVRSAIDELDGPPIGALLFNCGGRALEAQQSGLLDQLGPAMCQGMPAAGFTTYSEQFGPLVLNHTLTGLIFGKADG